MRLTEEGSELILRRQWFPLQLHRYLISLADHSVIQLLETLRWMIVFNGILPLFLPVHIDYRVTWTA
jgi:hypothetical protein